MHYSARLFAVLSLAMLAGCTDTADTFPLNTAARDMGPLQVSFVRTGIGRGPVTITMADGEVLKGEWRVNASGGQAFAFAGGRSASALVIGDGTVQFVVTGPKTQLLCRGDAGAFGHGSGQCQTFEGALWAFSW